MVLPELAARGISLLPRHGDAEPFLRVDEVIMIILAEIELHPVEVSKTQRLNVATLSDYGDSGGSGYPLREIRTGKPARHGHRGTKVPLRVVATPHPNRVKSEVRRSVPRPQDSERD